MAEMERIKTGLAPIAAADARLFVLGSLPGDASLAAQRYYAHPTNQFWRLLGQAIGEQLQPLDYGDRLARLGARGIAADRAGSLDQSIRNAEHNRLAHILEDFPDLRAIAFNGKAAAARGRRLIGDPPRGIALIDLPSSSAAYTLALADKARAWAALGRYCR